MQAAVRFAAAGDLMHASNVRYMLAQRAVEAGERLAEVPVWLDECESFAASHGYRHELAHIHLVRAAYERRQDRLDGARELLGDALTVFRQAGDLRCVTRTLLELAGHHRAGQPADLASALHSPACAAYVDEGRAGGVGLIITRYPRLPVSSLSSSLGRGRNISEKAVETYTVKRLRSGRRSYFLTPWIRPDSRTGMQSSRVHAGSSRPRSSGNSIIPGV
jgi:hypothetical protein